MELSEKVKELVAVGAGADSWEVAAAIEVGKQVRKGASAKMDQFSSSLKETHPAPAEAEKSACCEG